MSNITVAIHKIVFPGGDIGRELQTPAWSEFILSLATIGGLGSADLWTFCAI